jgi:hypothetical protein
MEKTKKKRIWYATNGQLKFFFAAPSILQACTRAAEFMKSEKWSGAELWETTNKPILRREL